MVKQRLSYKIVCNNCGLEHYATETMGRIGNARHTFHILSNGATVELFDKSVQLMQVLCLRCGKTCYKFDYKEQVDEQTKKAYPNLKIIVEKI